MQNWGENSLDPYFPFFSFYKLFSPCSEVLQGFVRHLVLWVSFFWKVFRWQGQTCALQLLNTVCKALQIMFWQPTSLISFLFLVLWMSSKGRSNRKKHPFSSLCDFYSFPTYFGSIRGKSLGLRSWSYLWSNFSLPVLSKYRDLLWSFFTLIKILLCYY